MAGTLTRNQIITPKWDLFTRVVKEADDADTLITAKEMGKGMNDGAWGVNLKTQVAPHTRVRLAFMGRDAANEVAEVVLYGFFKNGPGHKIALLTVTLGAMDMDMSGADIGAFAGGSSKPGMTDRIAAVAAPEGDWLMVDTIVKTTEWEDGVIAVPTTQETDHWTFADVNMIDQPYEYLIAEINVSTAAALMGMWIPLQ